MSDTIDNPRGGKVLKVAQFDRLKKIWGKYDHDRSLTDFELNEFISKKLRKTPNFNLETHLKKTSLVWKNFKLHFPSADKKEFTIGTVDGDYNIYYEDTPIEVLGDHVSEKKFNDRVKKSLDILSSFPISLLSTLKKYPIPGTPYHNSPPKILNEFAISVSSTQSFLAKFRDIFKATIVTFTSAAQCYRWQRSPNLNYWPQQLNFAVWCATSGCGICLNESYPKRIQEVINFHIYFTIRRLLWELKIPLPDDPFFHQTSNHYNKIEYQRLCQEFNLHTNSDFRFHGGRNLGLGTIFVNGRIPAIASGLSEWPNSTPIFHDEHGIGGVNGKIINLANEGRPYDWFAPDKGKGLTRAGLGRLNRSVEAFVYCVVGAEVNVRSSIVDNGGGGQETQQEMLKLFEEAVIEEDIAKSVQRYQLAIQEAKHRLDFAIAPNVWLMSSNLIINTKSVIGYNNFLVKANKDMTFGENQLLNNKIKKVGLDHNLGTGRINQHIAKINEEPITPQIHTVDPDDDDDDGDDELEGSSQSRKGGIKKQSSTIESSHDLLKATAIIVAGVVGYMMFR